MPEAVDERARRDASLLEAGRGVEARGQHRVGLRDPPRLVRRWASSTWVRARSRGSSIPSSSAVESLRGGFARTPPPRSPRRRAQVVVDRTLDARDRGGKREVVGELGQDAGRVGRVDALERLADAEVQLGAIDAR